VLIFVTIMPGDTAITTSIAINRMDRSFHKSNTSHLLEQEIDTLQLSPLKPEVWYNDAGNDSAQLWHEEKLIYRLCCKRSSPAARVLKLVARQSSVFRSYQIACYST
jgi:hypothetical protein